MVAHLNYTDTQGNSADKLRYTRSVAYSVELVLLNQHQITSGGVYLQCYQPKLHLARHVSIRHDTFDVSSVSSSAARQARHSQMHGLDTSNVSCRVET